MNQPQPIHFKSIPPRNHDELGANIAHALSLNLPEADSEPIKTLTIIANGPSALQAPLKGITGPTLAINGSLSLFTRQGLAPTYWIACDPQPGIADFLDDAPLNETIYLLASTLDPIVFERLKHHKKRLWHIDTHPLAREHRTIKTASTVTLMSFALMRRAFGFRHFEVYGWDACYDGLKHHASDPDLTEPDPNGWSLMIGERPFYTKPCWALEGEEALIMLQRADFTVNVHGHGLIATLIEHNAQRISAENA